MLPQRSIWLHPKSPDIVQIVDQRPLPHQLVIADLTSTDEAIVAIKDMWVRGAPLIGATAAYGVYFAVKEARTASNPAEFFSQKIDQLLASRPTAVNLAWAVNRQLEAILGIEDWGKKAEIAFDTANQIVEEDVAQCHQIGVHGLALIEDCYKKTGKPVQVLTHCNAGRMACVAWGTATSPIYQAHAAGIPVHVWVDETRPRNQGARITAWELAQAGIPHTVIVDNAGGHLMQHGMVDLCLVGSDRTTLTGDVANKIGTYLKALAAHDNDVPFYVALPSTTIDFTLKDGLKEIPIEKRAESEVTKIQGWTGESLEQVLLTPKDSPAANYAFDVTPARLVMGLITERGICDASEAGIRGLFPDLG